MYAKIQNSSITQYPYTVQNLYNDNPNVSFPADLSDALLAQFNTVRVIVTGQPEYNRMTQAVNETTPLYSQARSRWEQQWQVVSLSAEQIAANEAAAKAANGSQASAALRDTDWCENASVRDTSVTPHLVNFAEFDAYRLALRVIAINPPVIVDVWPTRPTSTWSA